MNSKVKNQILKEYTHRTYKDSNYEIDFRLTVNKSYLDEIFISVECGDTKHIIESNMVKKIYEELSLHF